MIFRFLLRRKMTKDNTRSLSLSLAREYPMFMLDGANVLCSASSWSCENKSQGCAVISLVCILWIWVVWRLFFLLGMQQVVFFLWLYRVLGW